MKWLEIVGIALAYLSVGFSFSCIMAYFFHADDSRGFLSLVYLAWPLVLIVAIPMFIVIGISKMMGKVWDRLYELGVKG